MYLPFLTITFTIIRPLANHLQLSRVRRDQRQVRLCNQRSSLGSPSRRARLVIVRINVSLAAKHMTKRMFMLTGSYSSGEGTLNKSNLGKGGERGRGRRKWIESPSLPRPHLQKREILVKSPGRSRCPYRCSIAGHDSHKEKCYIELHFVSFRIWFGLQHTLNY